MGYSAFNRFVVDAKQRESTAAPIELVFIRSGIANWKLTSARIP
jgi:hypothetical protein